MNSIASEPSARSAAEGIEVEVKLAQLEEEFWHVKLAQLWASEQGVKLRSAGQTVVLTLDVERVEHLASLLDQLAKTIRRATRERTTRDQQVQTAQTLARQWWRLQVQSSSQIISGA